MSTSIPFNFSGDMEVTAAGNADRMLKTGSVPGLSGTKRVIGARVTGVSGLAGESGDDPTIIVVSSVSYAAYTPGVSDGIELSLPYNASTLALVVSGAFDVLALSTLYCFCIDASGHHAGVTVQALVEDVAAGETAGETLTALAVQTRFSYLMADESNVRWTDANFWLWCGDAQRELLALRPELGMADDETYNEPVDPTADASELAPSRDYALCLAHFCCACAFEQDANDQANLAAAKQHMAEFYRLAGVER